MLAAGANDYLSKPVRLKTLFTCIQQWIKQPCIEPCIETVDQVAIEYKKIVSV